MHLLVEIDTFKSTCCTFSSFAPVEEASGWTAASQGFAAAAAAYESVGRAAKGDDGPMADWLVCGRL